MLLPADLELTLEPLFGDAQRLLHITTHDLLRLGQKAALRQRFGDGEDGWQRLTLDAHVSGGVLRLALALRDHPRHGLPVVTHLGGEERLIATCWPDVIFTGH